MQSKQILASSTQTFLEELVHRLSREYPSTYLGNKRNPLNELLYIILSGQTSEILYKRAYLSFKRKFPQWQNLLNAKLNVIETTISDAGLARQKANYLSDIAVKLHTDFGKVSLAPLQRMPLKQAEQYLISLPGVGVKSARCVLMYSLGFDVFPLDIHCARIMDRLHLIKLNGKRLDTLADAAQDKIPPALRKQLHILFVQHGRVVCRSKASCHSCVLNDMCPSSTCSIEKSACS